MSGVAWWSQTATTNASADPSIGWAEGMAPSSVNDSARAEMASVAKWRDDISGAVVTAGTSTAFTVASNQAFDTLARLNGQMIAFTPHATNNGTTTLNVDGLGAKPLRSAPSTELVPGHLIQGTPYVAVYNSSDAAFYLQGFFGNPYNIPIGGLLDYSGSTAPNANFVLSYGQAISRTTYSGLFALLSTAFGSGDGSTTFNVPDLRGRVVAGKDDMGGSAASRLTSTYFGTGATTLGGVGSSGESTQLVTGNLPPYTPSVSLNTGTVTIGNTTDGVQGAGGTTVVKTINGTGAGTATSLAVSGFSVTSSPQGGTSTPLRTVQPTLILNKILRVI